MACERVCPPPHPRWSSLLILVALLCGCGFVQEKKLEDDYFEGISRPLSTSYFAIAKHYMEWPFSVLRWISIPSAVGYGLMHKACGLFPRGLLGLDIRLGLTSVLHSVCPKGPCVGP